MKTQILVFLMVIVCCLSASGRQLLPGDAYLADGQQLIARDTMRFEVPAKKEDLKVYAQAYTSAQKVCRKIPGSDIDSLVVWSATAPDCPHTLRYIAAYGWCWQLERTPHIAVYCFDPKGYGTNGGGGMWHGGKAVILVEKNGKIIRFKNPYKMADKGFRRRVAALVADDPALAAAIQTAVGRRNKILRMLSNYSPNI